MMTGKLLLAAGAAALVVTNTGTAAADHKAPRHHKVAANAATPTAGYCDATTAKYVTVAIQQDMPSPRCWQVRPGQRLRVRDDLHKAVKVRWRPYAAVTLQAGQTVTFDRPLGSYLQPGDHPAWISAYAGGGGFELYLPTHRPAPIVSAG